MDEMAMIRRAREAVARGDQATARQLLVGLLHEQPNSETAWLMLATLVEQLDRKRDCLERVLRINPGNDVARAQLAALVPQTAPAVEAAPAPEVAPAAVAAEDSGQPAVSTEPQTAGASVVEGTAEADDDALRDAGDVQLDAFTTEQAPPGAETGAVAPQEIESGADGAGPTPDSELPPTEPAPEAGALPSPQPAAEPALMTDEAATVLGNSLLIDSLAPGERALHRTTLTPWVFLRPLIALLGAVIVVSLPGGTLPEPVLLACRAGLLVLTFAYFGLRAIRYFGSEYVVTDRRVLARRGFLARLRVDLPLREVEEVTVGRGSGQHGSLWIRRTDGTRVMFWRIREPGAFRDAIERGRAALGESA